MNRLSMFAQSLAFKPFGWFGLLSSTVWILTGGGCFFAGRQTTDRLPQQHRILVPVSKELGVASWYGPGFHGNTTASGEVFNGKLFTAAHNELPFGTLVRVRSPKKERSVIVRINDRGPYCPGRVIDLSEAAAKQLGLKKAGVEKVVIEVLEQMAVYR
ncbi:MAG: septal ring lytic transglycosylase RlpA family protein [Nitrospirota bacterium]|nr:septal ring lytic transglycosylase RlpA family protein [Nitrospirota bacterium]